MPRKSHRKQFLDFVCDTQQQLSTMAQWNFLLNLGVENDLDDLLAAVSNEVQRIEDRRYLYERMILPSQAKWVVLFYNMDRYNDNFFLRHFRMDREVFWSLEYMMGQLPAFHTVPTMRPRAPVPLLLLVFLKFMGTEGTDGSYAKIGDVLGVSIGSVANYVKRAVQGFMEIR